MTEPTEALTLADYGWSEHFRQAEADLAVPGTVPVRVLAVHRDALDVAGPDFAGRIVSLHTGDAVTNDTVPTAGDWLAVDPAARRMAAIYPRTSIFWRRNAGTTSRPQPIAANIDTVLIATSANQEFNVARIERYLAVAHEAGVVPVLVITKTDMADPAPFVAAARRAAPQLVIEPVNAKDPASLAVLSAFLQPGQTLAVLGSSGVGKSTLANSLLGQAAQATGGIRGDDTGKHTTTGRSLLRLPGGAWLLDTPGIRELQLVDVEDGIAAVFADVADLERQCRFSNCGHAGEPGCAIQAAISDGRLDPQRLERFRKLDRESRRNSEAVKVARARHRRMGRLSRTSQDAKRRDREP